MGRYLDCGIATRIIVKKEHFSSSQIIEDFKKELDFNIYNYLEEENYIIFYIKEELFEKHIIDFILEQIEVFNPILDDSYEEDIIKLRELKGKTSKELLKIADEKSVYFFQYLEGNFFCNDVGYICEKYTAYADIISYWGDGKVFMECYYNLFYYLRKLIIQNSKNPIKTAAVVSIIG